MELRKVFTWTAVIVLSMVLGGAAVLGLDELRGNDNASPAVIERVSPASGAGVNTAIEDVADLYDAVRPSVVRITGQATRGGSGLGSGVVIDKQGHILTNNHVVRGFDTIDVTFADRTAVSAKVVGTDAGNDLAIIKVEVPADRLKPAKLGDSDKVRIGEFVIAVGNPFDLSGTLTQGVVSGVGRTLAGNAGRPLRQLIQSDAAINPGNSGGALFNKRGEVIGITTAIENPSGDRVFVGIGYAVPISAAQRFLPEMIQGRTIQHPRLGVGLQNVTPALSGRLGLQVDQGVMITTVEPGSAAARAGLRPSASGRGGGDVVIAIDGNEIKTFDDLANYIDTKNVGDTVQVKVMRDGKEQTVSVTLEAWAG